MWLLALFILVPLIEIALFIQIGGWLTLWPTLGIVVLTALLGTWLVRQQGALAIRKLQRSLEELDDPLTPLADGAMILFSGALLLTPGFLTDAVGFALLLPGVRAALIGWIVRHRVHHVVMGRPAQRDGGPHGPGPVIDAEFEDLGPDRPGGTGAGTTPPRGPRPGSGQGTNGATRPGGSGWTRR